MNFKLQVFPYSWNRKNNQYNTIENSSYECWNEPRINNTVAHSDYRGTTKICHLRVLDYALSDLVSVYLHLYLRD